MKTVKEIRKEIQKTRAAIEAKTAEIIKLNYTEERREAAQAGHFHNEAWKELYKKAQDNAGAVSKLCDEVYKLEIKNRILRDNLSCALIAEALPVILKACEPYQGKPYGAKTADKISEEVKKAGYSFYFDGNGGYRLNINELTKEGYNSGLNAIAAAYDEGGHVVDCITKDNRLNTTGANFKPWKDKYTENPTKAAGEVAKAIKKYEEATKAIEAQRRALCDILPDGIEKPQYIKEYYVRF